MTSDDHRQFWAAIIAELKGSSAWLVYADRLEEAGQGEIASIMRRSRIESVRFNALTGDVAFQLIGMPPLLDHLVTVQGNGLIQLRQQRAVSRLLSGWDAAILVDEAGARATDELRERLGFPPLPPAPRAPGTITPTGVNRATAPRRRRRR